VLTVGIVERPENKTPLDFQLANRSLRDDRR
jgi:hypothetical protein